MTDRRLALRAWLLAMDRLEVTLRVEQARARNAMIRSAATSYTKLGHPPAHVFIAHRTRVKGVIEDHYRRTIPVFAGMALKQIKSRRIQKKAAQTMFESLVAEWIAREALRKATMIADTDRDDVLNAITGGLNEGLGVEEIARNIRKVSQLTPYRAATIARTETHAAATFGSIESVRQAEQELGVVMMKEWLATKDDRTRPEHLAADGQQVAMDEKFRVGGEMMDRPGDPNASPHNTVNCLHPDSVIQSGDIKAMTRHWYEGQLVTIKTASGSELTVTPNHPVLTRSGWVAASRLQQADGVISCAFPDGESLGSLDVQHVEATAEKIFDALSIVQAVVRIGRADVDFHGERPYRDVDVIYATGELRNALVAAIRKPAEHFRLACTDLAQGRLLAYSLLYRVRVVKLGGLVADSFVSLFRQASTLFRRGIRHPLEHAFAAVPGLDPVIGEAKHNVTALFVEGTRQRLDGLPRKKAVGNRSRVSRALPLLGCRNAFSDRPERYPGTVESAVNRGGRDAVLRGKLRNRGSGKVFVDQIVGISHMAYSGYVYNLETRNGYYICNGIVQHNCRCAIIYSEAE